MFMKMPKIHIGKKKDEVSPIPMTDIHGRIPADRVASLSSQGMSEPEIIRTLRSEGYSPIEVDSAMKDALRSAVRPGPARIAPPPTPTRGFGAPPEEPIMRERRLIFSGDEVPGTRPNEQPFSEEETIPENELELPRFPGMAQRKAPPLPVEEADMEDLEPVSPSARPTPREDRMKSRHEYEEIAESVVEEKWGTFERQMEDVIDRVKELTIRVNNMQQAMDRLQGERKGDLNEITEKIESYKQSIIEVSSRMEGMERTMKDSMTPMMQSLRSLSEAVRTFKETRK